MFEIIPITVFRNTPEVYFYDATVEISNGCDVVTHGPLAVSPPNKDNQPQFYIHYSQVDYNMCVLGTRTFELINPLWDDPYHVVKLTDKTGILKIPTYTYHRSISGKDGSVLINQPHRLSDFSYETEFVPVSVSEDTDLVYILSNVKPIIH